MSSKIEENDMTQTSFSTEKTKVHSNESEEEITQQQQQQKKTNEEIKKKIEDEQPKKEELSSEAKHVHVTLDESELWKKFKTLTNEMIVTKNGRYDFIGSQRKC